MPEPNLTSAQQNLLNFLDKLASSPYSPELMQEGYQALDEAVEENRQLTESIEASTKDLSRPGADLLPPTDNESKGIIQS